MKVVFYNKPSWFVFELPKKVISNVHGDPVKVVFYNKPSWFLSELPEKDILNVVVQCR